MTVICIRLFFYFPEFHAAFFIVGLVTDVYSSREKLPKTNYLNIPNFKLALNYICISIHMLTHWKLRSQNAILTFHPIQENDMNTAL